MVTIERSRLLHGLLVGACLVVVIAGMRAAAPFLSPLLLALFLAILLYPVYKWLLGRGIPTWLAVILMVAGVMLVGMGVLALLWLSVEQLRANLFIYAARLLDREPMRDHAARIRKDTDAPGGPLNLLSCWTVKEALDGFLTW